MATHFFDEFDVDPPKIHPMTGDLMLVYRDTDEGGRYVFPIPKEDALAYYEAIGEALGKNGAKIVPATMQEVHNVTSLKPR